MIIVTAEFEKNRNFVFGFSFISFRQNELWSKYDHNKLLNLIKNLSTSLGCIALYIQQILDSRQAIATSLQTDTSASR